MNVKLIQGFGTTETTAVGMTMDQNDKATGRCGAPLFGAKVRLHDWQEGGYRATDKPNPRGELVIGGDFVAQGYFKRDQETQEAFKEEKVIVIGKKPVDYNNCTTGNTLVLYG